MTPTAVTVSARSDSRSELRLTGGTPTGLVTQDATKTRPTQPVDSDESSVADAARGNLKSFPNYAKFSYGFFLSGVLALKSYHGLPLDLAAWRACAAGGSKIPLPLDPAGDHRARPGKFEQADNG